MNQSNQPNQQPHNHNNGPPSIFNLFSTLRLHRFRLQRRSLHVSNHLQALLRHQMSLVHQSTTITFLSFLNNTFGNCPRCKLQRVIELNRYDTRKCMRFVLVMYSISLLFLQVARFHFLNDIFRTLPPFYAPTCFTFEG